MRVEYVLGRRALEKPDDTVVAFREGAKQSGETATDYRRVGVEVPWHCLACSVSGPIRQSIISDPSIDSLH